MPAAGSSSGVRSARVSVVVVVVAVARPVRAVGLRPRTRLFRIVARRSGGRRADAALSIALVAADRKGHTATGLLRRQKRRTRVCTCSRVWMRARARARFSKRFRCGACMHARVGCVLPPLSSPCVVHPAVEGRAHPAGLPAGLAVPALRPEGIPPAELGALLTALRSRDRI
eukprot:3616848-Pleurochrysis_carterae.AAC.2